MPESVKSVRFNVSKLVFAIILEDTISSFKYAPIKKLGEPMQVQLTYTLATGVVYGAGVKQFNPTKLTGATLQMDINKIPIEIRAEMFGNTYANGVLHVSKNDKPKKIAIGYELEAESDSGIQKEMEWLYKGDPQPFGKTTNQTTDNITFSTDTLTVNFVPRDFDGRIKSEGDTANSAFTTEAAGTFLATIPGGTLVTEG